MKKFVSNVFDEPVVSTEHFVSLSAEEEAIATSETDEHLINAHNAEDAIWRLFDIKDGVDDVNYTVSTLPTMGAVETNLVGVASEMAMAGEEGDPNDLMPTKEGGGISTEGLVDTVKKIWQKITELVSQMWKYLVDFCTNTFGTVERLKRRLVTCQEKLKTIGNRQPDPTKSGSYGQTMRHFASNGAFCINGRSVFSGFGGSQLYNFDDEFNKIDKLLGSIYAKAPDAVMKVGHVVENMFSKFDPEKVPKGLGYTPHPATEAIDISGEMLNGFARELGAAFGNYMHCFTDSTKVKHTRNYQIASSGPILGNFQVDIEFPINMDRLPPLELFHDLKKVKPKAVNSSMLPDTVGIQIKLQPTSVYMNFVKKISYGVDLILKFKNGHMVEKLEAQSKAIRTAADKALANLKESNDSAAANVVQQMLPLTAAYGTWSKEPMASATSKIVRTYAAFLHLIEDALTYYENHPQPASK